MSTSPIYKLRCPVRHYAWGSPTFIPALLGQENPTSQPYAELWVGAHPSAPALLEGSEPPITLDGWLGQANETRLGARSVAQHGPELPFLLKVLAASAPLSIQCHPNQAQARAGYARENEAQIPLDARHRNYRDPNHKPELIVALTQFWALKGFRPPAEIDSEIRKLGLESSLHPQLERLSHPDGLRDFFHSLATTSADRRAAILAALGSAAANNQTPRCRWIERLLNRYPDDLGALAPLYLQLVELAPGDGLFLPAGELHAYLEGAGLELMANSDNVLRGGLTPKHIDVPELLATLRFESSPVDVLRPVPQPHGRHMYQTPATEFVLSYIDVSGTAAQQLGGRASVELVLCTDGQVTLAPEGAEPVHILRGQAAVLAADVPAVELQGRGRLYIASVPSVAAP